MKGYDRWFIGVFGLACLLNGWLLWKDTSETTSSSHVYRVEIKRAVEDIQANGLAALDETAYPSLQQVVLISEEAMLEEADAPYEIHRIQDQYYRFDIRMSAPQSSQRYGMLWLNLFWGSMLFFAYFFLRKRVLKPFAQISTLPARYAKGDFTAQIPALPDREVKQFLWGMDALREQLMKQKQDALALQKEKDTLLLSISHDIKTPLASIKLYANALCKQLYTAQEATSQIGHKINQKVDDIECFVSDLIRASDQAVMKLHVDHGAFYSDDLIDHVLKQNEDRFQEQHIRVITNRCLNCLLQGDFQRSVEVVQNVIENAIKYGDGDWIELTETEEEDCRLLTISNGGCHLPPHEVPHIFERFWRGSNAQYEQGNGLGLYISTQLMHQMNGELFAKCHDQKMHMTLLFRK